MGPVSRPAGRWRENRPVSESPLQGLTIGITAERRSAQQAELFVKRGAEVLQ
jgi:hypothetical protein